MEIVDGVLRGIFEEDISEDGSLVIPEGVKKIDKRVLYFLKGIKKLQLPNSLEHIDHDELIYFVDITELNIPDGITNLAIKTPSQQASYKMLGKTKSLFYRSPVHPWKFLRLPKGFQMRNPAADGYDPLENATLVVTLDSLERVIAEDNYHGEDVILSIKNASELSVEKLKMLTNKVNITSIQIVDIEGQGLSYESTIPYDVETYLKCRTKIDELLADIDFKKYDDNPNREKYIFGEIVRRLSKITYDKVAYRQGTLSDRHFVARNLVGGLLDGTSVCVGYSEILRNILACCNIDAKLIAGGGHCWNQVKLDGKWYNVDLTMDQSLIQKGRTPKRLLKSDKDFKGYNKMLEDYKARKEDLQGSIISPLYKDSQLEECTDTVPEDELLQYIYGEGFEKPKKSPPSIAGFFKPISSLRSRLNALKKLINDQEINNS